MQYTDEQIGRLLDFLEREGLTDNTLILVMSDNGASGEGGTHGSANEYRYFLGLEDRFEDSLARIDQLGGPFTHNHYPSGWAQAGKTPLRMYKKFTYGGGDKGPVDVHPPAPALDAGAAARPPTTLDLLGLDLPSTFRDVEVRPFDGSSLAYSLADATAEGRRGPQYFETAGYRGIVKDGYKAVADHEPGTDYDLDHWSVF